MRLYLSGPMANYPGHNRDLFNHTAKQLRDVGFEVVNPGEVDHGPDAAWEDCLRADLRTLLDCDGVATLFDWQCSRGACLEVHVAKELRLRVLPCKVWLEQAKNDTGCPGRRDLASPVIVDLHRLPRNPRRRAARHPTPQAQRRRDERRLR